MILEQPPKTELINYMTIPGLKLAKNLNNQQVIDCIIDTVCTYLQVPKKLVVSKTRRKEVVRAKHICRWYLTKRTNMTLSAIGLIWEGVDHTTIIHSRNYVKQQIEAKHPNEFKKHIHYLDKQL
jgi:chromosomal replication initiator protein